MRYLMVSPVEGRESVAVPLTNREVEPCYKPQIHGRQLCLTV